MMAGLERTRVLITVMTYPHPSDTYQELVCTAGVTEAGEWVRLYPIDYRYRPKYQQFHKYQWIEVALSSRGASNDKRPESRKPDLESIEIMGEPMGTSDGWAERRVIIDRMRHRTVGQLQAQYDIDRTSLGIVRPKRVLELMHKPADSAWKPEWQALFEQSNLFSGPPKSLRKLPYSFHYIFECEDDSKPRTAMIEDWELGVLFLKEAERLGSESAAIESVKTKFYGQMCAAGIDTRFFMGTRFPYNTWLVLGVFWPPRPKPTLFGPA